MPDFEYDDEKCAANIEKHGFDFDICHELFDGRPMISKPSPKAGELRHVSVCAWEARFVAVIWTWRGPIRRIISIRAARKGERRAYEAIFS
jgi:uncharacterized DUF497 family protein